MMFTGGRASHSKRRNAGGGSGSRKPLLDQRNSQPRKGPEGYTYK